MMNMCGGGKVWIHTFFTLALGVAEWSSPNSTCFILSEEAPCTHWIEDRVGLGIVLDMVVKKKSTPLLGI
jgi:hypothetical protein